ncbi:MAG: YbhB/YbcL family Raf kinase inhibitor-like protein [Bacteroidia bacterium]
MNPLTSLFMAIVVNKTLTVKSPAFVNNGHIPAKYTCDNAGINPPLTIGGVPEEAQSLVLIVDDPDAPGKTFDHWLMWNIPVTGKIEENSAPGVQGRNSRKENKYMGPCPPRGIHHYHFRMYALDVMLEISPDSDKEDLLKAMDGHIVASGELIGLYAKQ